MKINLTEIVSQLENAKNSQLTEKQKIQKKNSEEMSRYEKIIRSIAGKYGRDWCLTFDDVYSELSYKILTLGTSAGWENLNEAFVARVCYNKAVDLYRAARRKKEREISETALLGNNSEKAQSKIGTTEEAEQLVLISQFVELYNLESRERKYLTIRLVSEELLPEKYALQLGITIPSGKIPDWRISEMLGLSPRSKSFEKMKKALREELSDYLNGDFR